MILASEEKSTRGPLIVFIDLLFLLIAFFTLLLFFIQARNEISDKQLESVQQSLARITGEQVNVPEALDTLEMVVDRFLSSRDAELERERKVTERRRRRAERTVVRLEYTLAPRGQIRYEGRNYSTARFLEQVVAPLRAEHWVSFRAFATPETPFGAVVNHREVLLKDASEFDTYWDNLTRGEPEGAQGAAASQPAAPVR